MKRTYTLYSAEFENGKELAIVYDEQQMNVLEPYYRQVYNNRAFKVTVRRPRQKEQWVCGWYEN